MGTRKRRKTRAVAGAVLLFLPLWSGAQTRYATDPLENGHLVLWVVQTAPPPPPTADQVRATLHTATAGSFGRNAGDVGQTAGSYSGDRNASHARAGTPAPAASQPAGSFGNSLDTIASAGNSVQDTSFEPATLTGLGTFYTHELHRSFPGLHLRVVPVSAGDLQARFAALGPQSERPDLLLSDEPMVERNRFLVSMTLAHLGVPSAGERLLRERNGSQPRPWDWLILRDAPDPAEARAFVVWVRDGWRTRIERSLSGTAPQALRELASAAAASLLNGSAISDADPTMVPYSPAAARRMALNAPSDDVVQGVQSEITVLSQGANERFAAFGMRAIVGSGEAFGVVYPFVVLRRDDQGRWRVLHISGDRSPEYPWQSLDALGRYTLAVPPEKLKPVAGITQAAPVDGDSRPGTPDFWWDNPGDAGLLVLEWSRDRGDAHLFYVPDTASRLQVRVSGTFAEKPGEYRWRVWSMGAGGVMTLSPWRRLIVLP